MAFAPPVALDYLRRAHAGNRLGHAYLIVGAKAAFELAKQLAAVVARTDPSAVLANPDVYVVEPESKSRRIVVEQVRELEHSLRLRASVDGGRKVGILREADRLQPQAANAFLKTLEEPPAGSLLLLVSAQPEAMMETILSRCIKVTLQAPAGTDVNAPPEETALLAMLTRHAREQQNTAEPASVPAAYRLLREFTGLLAVFAGVRLLKFGVRRPGAAFRSPPAPGSKPRPTPPSNARRNTTPRPPTAVGCPSARRTTRV